MNEAQANFSSLLGQVDTFLLMTVSLALMVGIVGIINTMLMSTTERFAEFGVLRTNGWSQGNILALVTLESAYLGLLAGVAGCLLAAIGTTVINQFLSDAGIHLGMTLASGARHRALGSDGNLRRLPRLAGGPAVADGSNSAGLALTDSERADGLQQPAVLLGRRRRDCVFRVPGTPVGDIPVRRDVDREFHVMRPPSS